MFSFKRPSLSIRPRFLLDLLQGSSAVLYIICLKSFNLPGAGNLPSSSHFSLDLPPFHALVVKPSISVFTAHLSRVLARISPHIAAIVIGLPLIEPELSINKETIVSLNSISFSILKDNGDVGSIITLVSLDTSKRPSSRSNSHDLFC